MYLNLYRFFPECFSAVLDLQTWFSTKINDPHTRQPFCNIFLRQHAFDNLHGHTRDLFESIPEIPGQKYDDSNLRKIDFNTTTVGAISILPVRSTIVSYLQSDAVWLIPAIGSLCYFWSSPSDYLWAPFSRFGWRYSTRTVRTVTKCAYSMTRRDKKRYASSADTGICHRRMTNDYRTCQYPRECSR
jgi:hypothetical protein